MIPDFSPDAGSVEQAARYKRWWGRADSCLLEPDSLAKVGQAEKILLAADPVLVCEDGRRMEVLCFMDEGGSACVRVTSPAGTRYATFVDVCVGRFSQPVAQYELAPGAPSRWVSGCYAGGALVLSLEDAERFGLRSPRAGRVDDLACRELFGSNVTVIR